jgi:hypothetical protein
MLRVCNNIHDDAAARHAVGVRPGTLIQHTYPRITLPVPHTREVGIAPIDHPKVGAREVCPDKAGPRGIGTREIGLSQVGKAQVTIRQHRREAEVHVAQLGSLKQAARLVGMVVQISSDFTAGQCHSSP